MSLRIWLALCFSLFWSSVLSTTQITFYSDSACSVYVHDQIGPDDGCCQTLNFAFQSFLVTGNKDSCPVTVYLDDIPFCSSNVQTVAAIGHCYTNTTIGTYSIDCPSGFQASNCPDLPISSTGIPSLAQTVATSARSSSYALTVVSTTIATPTLGSSLTTVKTTADSHTLGIASASSASSTYTSNATIVSSGGATSISSPGSNSTDLPLGVKIGIGASAGVAALVIIVVSLICWRRRRPSKPAKGQIWQSGAHQVRNFPGLYELDQTRGPYELHHIPDMQHRNPLIQDIHGEKEQQTQHLFRSELDGSSISRDLETPNSAADSRYSYATGQSDRISIMDDLRGEYFEPSHKYIMPIEAKTIK